MCGFFEGYVGFGEEDEHPFVPGFDHAYEARPSVVEVLGFRLKDPVQIAFAGVDEVGEVYFDEDVQSEALARFLDERDVELAHDLGAATVAAEEVGAPDLVGRAGELVADGRKDLARGFAGMGEEGCAEADVPAFCCGALYEDGLEDGLWEVDMSAGSCTLVLSFAIGIVAP